MIQFVFERKVEFFTLGELKITEGVFQSLSHSKVNQSSREAATEANPALKFTTALSQPCK
jgi:hypothetical protein